MEMIRGQMVFLAGSVVSGFAVMGCYEIVRVVRRVLRLKTIGKWMVDTIYFLVAAILVFKMIFLCNQGTLRIFFGIAFVLGAVAYHRIFGTAVSRGIIWVISGMCQKIIQPCVRKCKRLLKKIKKSEKKP
ncbi:MAG: spore cortex biosynthesis protein YabQ [Eubacterium sp.]